jgi:hypothetical protein
LVFFGLFLVQWKKIIDSFLSRNIYKYFFINIIEAIDKSFWQKIFIFHLDKNFMDDLP